MAFLATVYTQHTKEITLYMVPVLRIIILCGNATFVASIARVLRGMVCLPPWLAVLVYLHLPDRYAELNLFQ